MEVGRLVQFMDTGGSSLHETLGKERDQASEQLDFEKAATIHKKIEKLDDALRGQPELVKRIEQLDAVVLQRTTQEHTVAMFAVRGGRLVDPFWLHFEETGKPASAEETLRDYLESTTTLPAPNANTRQSAMELSEHLTLLARWFFSNPREGEIFFREKDWPYRRILRACSRLLAPKETQPQGKDAGPPGENTRSEGTK